MQDSTTPRVSGTQRYYRVQVDWEGGGFGYTVAFDDEAQALAWGRHKARWHPDAHITVIDRGPVSNDGELRAADLESIDDSMRLDQAREQQAQAIDKAVHEAKKRPEFMREWIDRKGWEQDMRAAWGPR